MYLSIETTKRKRNDHSPYEFMPDKIPAYQKVLVLHSFNGWKRQINRKDSIKYLTTLLKELEVD